MPLVAAAGAQFGRAIFARKASTDGRGAASTDGAEQMRIGKVIGKLCLQPVYPTLVGGRFCIVEVQDRFSLAGKARKTKESLVVYDSLGAQDGDLIAFSESGEATRP